MLMCPFTGNELIGLFHDAYRGLVLVYPVYDFTQFHDPLHKSRWTFRDQFWVLEIQLIRHKIQYWRGPLNQEKYNKTVLLGLNMCP